MSDPLRDVRDGEALQIPAAAYNAWCAAARAHNARAHDQSASASAELLAAGQIVVENGTAFDVEQFACMEIDEPAILPADNEADFGGRVFLKLKDASDPEFFNQDKGRFAILAEPISAGGFGRAWISGVCPARIHVVDAGHRFAEAASPQPKTRDAGSAQILWKEDGVGADKWAVLRLGNNPSRQLYKVELKAVLKEGQPSHTEAYLLTWDPGAEEWGGGWGSGDQVGPTVQVFADAGFTGYALPTDLIDVIKIEGLQADLDRYYAIDGGRHNLQLVAKANCSSVTVDPNGANLPASISQNGGGPWITDAGGYQETLIPIGVAWTNWEAGDYLQAWWISTDDGAGNRRGLWAAARFGSELLACGLERDGEGRLRVKLSDIAGLGFTINSSGDCETLDLDCTAVAVCVSSLIPHAGCGMQEDEVEGLKYHSFDAAAVAGSYLSTWGTCGLDVNIPAVIGAITTQILNGLADALINAILSRILASDALRRLFCKLVCSCGNDPPPPPECDGEPIYEWADGAWALLDDCGCENPIPPAEDGDECDPYKEGTCCEGQASWTSDGTGWSLVYNDCPEGQTPAMPAGTGEDGEYGCTICEPDITCEDTAGLPIFRWTVGDPDPEWVLINPCDCAEEDAVEPAAPGEFLGDMQPGTCDDSGVSTLCCPNPIPPTLNATASLVMGNGSGPPCNCTATATSTATYNGSRWIVDFTFAGCGQTLHMELYCAAGVWNAAWTVCGITTGGSTAMGTPTCDPFEVVVGFDSADACACGGIINGQVTFTA